MTTILKIEISFPSLKIVNSKHSIPKHSTESKRIIMLGDANLCMQKWNEPDFIHKKVAEKLKAMLEECEMSICNLGITFSADLVQKD